MNDNRPLSPHLSIHKKVLTSVFSITHRVTGIGLSIGSILISIWFLLISLGPEYFFYFEIISKNFLFKLILIFWTLGIFYHLFNGCRKLYWSFGIGMELTTVYRSGYLVLILTIISTVTVWFAL
jgi:succinate dehydrogenase, cytochrome b556 subunit